MLKLQKTATQQHEPNRLETAATSIVAISNLVLDIVREGSRSAVEAATGAVIGLTKGGEKARKSDTGTETIEGPKLVVWLVHPTNYRDDGTPRKYKRHILPANAIGQLYALMPKSVQDSEGRDLPIEVHFLEDTVQPFDPDAIAASMQGEGVSGVVMLVGVQTNQWPRGLNLAELCRARGIPVVAGGFHTRARLPLTLEQAEAEDFSLAIGEAEARLSGKRMMLDAILEDTARGTLQQVYEETELPPITTLPSAIVIPEYQKLMMSPDMATLESSRGCPQPCSFCTIRNITGTRVRPRGAEHLREALKANYESGIRFIFITDDNFAKSKEREQILDMFIAMRAEGMPMNLMIQVDVTATKGKAGEEFLKKCQAAGVYSVFMGVESVDPATLKAMDKPQNRVDEYSEIFRQWHDHGVLTQCGVIFGHQADTVGVGKRTAQTLIDMGMDVASGYVLTPLPGSRDYHVFHDKGYIKSSDFNEYDSHSHACIEFPDGLTPEQVMQEYREFYAEFFSWKNFFRLAQRLQGKALENTMRQWLWYKYAWSKGDHPMYSGAINLKSDFSRADFANGHAPTIADIAPSPDGPGAPQHEKRPHPLADAPVAMAR